MREEENADYMLCVNRGHSCAHGVLEFNYNHDVVKRLLILFKNICVLIVSLIKICFISYDFVLARHFTLFNLWNIIHILFFQV
jgi:hypothetical protein